MNAIYTNEISAKSLTELPDKYLISFFQKKIEITLEYSFLKEKYIPRLSRQNKITGLDSKECGFGVEGELVPVLIGKQTERKLIKLMDALNLNIGVTYPDKFFIRQVD